MNDTNPKIMRLQSLLEYYLHNRGVGNTQAAINGLDSTHDAKILVSSYQEGKSLKIKKKKFISYNNDLQSHLNSMCVPIIPDNSAMMRILSDALSVIENLNDVVSKRNLELNDQFEENETLRNNQEMDRAKIDLLKKEVIDMKTTKKDTMELVYLACPYSHPEISIMMSRVHACTSKAAHLMSHGFNVFSPITHSHYIANYMDEKLRLDHDFWLNRDFQIIDKCNLMVVLCLPGWDRSFGVQKEIEYCETNDVPIYYMHPQTNELTVTPIFDYIFPDDLVDLPNNLVDPPEPLNPMESLSKRMQDDFSYAWSWHCNIAMAAYDEGLNHKCANKAAARLMKSAFDVDITEHELYKKTQL